MGALTNKPMAFNSRNWEYNTQLTSDLTDFLSPRIRVDQFSGKIYRILPTVEWISNRIRFLYLGLKNQRIVTPMSSYKLLFDINLSDRLISFEKKILISLNFDKAFSIIKIRCLQRKKKYVNLILGSVFDGDYTVFNSFESKNTKIRKFLEVSKLANVNKLPSLDGKKNLIFWGINPRMESPLLNLKIKDNEHNIYSLGNYSYSYPVKVLSNNNYLFLEANKGFIENSLSFFGLSSLDLVNKNYIGEKALLVPLYILNNLFREFEVYDKKITTSDDINLFLLTQAKTNLPVLGFNVAISSHFEVNNNKHNNLVLPVSSYLETKINFINKELKLEKINSLKPSFGVSDLLFAFALKSKFLKKKICVGSNKFNYNFSKNKIINRVVSNSIPNYLIRDPIGRANPLFNKI